MVSKHTQGKWMAVHNSWAISTVYADHNKVIAECPIDGSVTEDSQDVLEPIKEANALLIAAAPDLLEALRECITDPGAVCFVRRDMHPEYMDRRLNYISDQARAAIAKATGEST